MKQNSSQKMQGKDYITCGIFSLTTVVCWQWGRS